MAKKVTGMIKLQVQAGKANPAPPIGPALGQHGVNIPGFCKEFNERTKNDVGLIIPVVITVYSDRSFTFITKTPPVPVLIKKALGLESGSGKPNKTKVGQLTQAQVREHRGCDEHGQGHRPLHGRDCRRRLKGGEKRGLPREAAC